MSDITWTQRISGDDDTVDRFLHEGMTAEGPSEADLWTAIEWLALYGAETQDDAQPYANVIAFLERTIATKAKRQATAEAKRAYAAEHGISVKQVRVNRNK